MAKPPPPPEPGRGKKLLYWILATGFSIVIAMIIAELFLRAVPIPGVSYHLFRYDELTGGGLYPNATMVYRSARGDHVRRRVNSMGFLDAEHDAAKPPHVVRIGFFGDSYTEAAQVDLEETFFRLIEARLNETSTTSRYECIAMGLSGYSTLQSYLECSRWMDVLDLDWVVYVFVENDPGDQIAEIRRAREAPTAYLDGDTFAVDTSFRERNRHKKSKLHRALQYLKARSLVISTITSRLKLLKREGIKITVTETDMQMTATGGAGALPSSSTPLSAWPDTLVSYTGAVGERVLAHWIDAVRSTGRSFAVLFIPREAEMAKPYAEQDGWALWLSELCERNAVDLIDPSEEFVRSADGGDEIFSDHLTPAGHEALARVFNAYFLTITGQN